MLKAENNLKLVSWQKDQPTEREPPPLASKKKAELVEDRTVASGRLLRYLVLYFVNMVTYSDSTGVHSPSLGNQRLRRSMYGKAGPFRSSGPMF
jgi:hypothetical protein